MASKDDGTLSTEAATTDNLTADAASLDKGSGLPGGNAAPVKKAAAKRAPRKATKKASAPQQAPPELAAEVPAQVDTEVTATGTSEADQRKDPARKTAKRAPRKSVKKASAAPVDVLPADLLPVDGQPTHLDVAADEKSEKVPEIPGFGLLFQAPEPTQAPRRRRATSPAAAPAAEPTPGHQAPADVTAKQGADARQDHTDQGDDSDDSAADGTRRRRRRGGKGRRGRAADEGGGDESIAGADETSTEGDSETKSSGQPSADDEESGDGASRRRTRRRRRGAAGDDEDQSGTTTRVREPRAPRNEVTSVKGSTRLEAKKQRRREGREAGRRRTVITEAEFLARRESVERVMVVRHKQDRTQIGVLEDGVLVEHYVSRETNASMAGNVYLGRIQNVLPSMEAAFVDIGKGRNAVLYAGEVNWDAAGLDNNRARKIENALSSGQGVLVQVTKDPIGHKGARLTSQVSLPGRYLVYVPDGNMMGISRKLPDTERARLKKILRDVVPENAGVIVRTAAEGASEDELRADVARLAAVWDEIQAKSKKANAPALLHGEPDLTVRVIRDVFNEDFASLVVSGDPAWETVNGYVNTVAPDLADRVKKWTGERDLFTHYRIDEQIAKAMDRKVWLPSGGSLVIDRTEAMTVVDVNTGKFVGSGGNLEETVTKNNIEAAEEVVRQLRLRDIGGIIVIDFIDMVLESNRDLVVRRLLECLGRDRTKHQVAEVTSLGLVQMTRKRVGAGLIEVFSENCEHCNGRGIIVSADPIDRPAGDDGGSPNGGGGGGGGKGGSGDAGSGRGTRGRRTRGSGRDTDEPVAPEPKITPGGPTPAQIAAAAHAAPIHGVSHEEPGAPIAVENDLLADLPPDLALGVPVEAAAPEKSTAPRSRRRASRSAKSPAVSVTPVVEPVNGQVDSVVVQPITGITEPAPSFQPLTRPESAAVATEAAPVAEAITIPEVSEVSEVSEASAPAARGRRKRARVVAPAGPPPVGEFDS
ncbi:MAG TPA: Rne/Rng family ribonuclease [Dermatophilaceae bacterium]